MKKTTKPKMGAPAKYTGGVKLYAIKVPLTPDQLDRIKSTTSPRQRAAVLLKLCDDIDAGTKSPST